MAPPIYFGELWMQPVATCFDFGAIVTRQSNDQERQTLRAVTSIAPLVR